MHTYISYLKKHRWKTLGVLILLLLVSYFIWDRFIAPPVTTPAMIAEANQYALDTIGEVPPVEFTYDGCTLIPEVAFGYDINRVCLEHDFAYWTGGTEAQQIAADEALFDGIKAGGNLFYNTVTANIIYFVLHHLGDTDLACMVTSRCWGHGFRE